MIEMGHEAMIECPRCQSWEFLDVTGLNELPCSSLICAECGMGWRHVRFRPASIIHAAEGPAVPTPEQLLAHAFGGWLS